MADILCRSLLSLSLGLTPSMAVCGSFTGTTNSMQGTHSHPRNQNLFEINSATPWVDLFLRARLFSLQATRAHGSGGKRYTTHLRLTLLSCRVIFLLGLLETL